MINTERTMVKGRFAPSPTGRMHLGNVYAALMSWLSAKKQGGDWLLRIEDLDPQRSRLEYAKQLEDDLHRLGLDWDEGGTENRAPIPHPFPYSQSERGKIYEEALRLLHATGLTYPCYCTRADLRATQAPHASDGRIIYPGTCRPWSPEAWSPGAPSPGGNLKPSTESNLKIDLESNLNIDSEANFAPRDGRKPAVRLMVPDEEMTFIDGVFGPQHGNLAKDCGDFVLRRADGAWAYQLAVVVDDIAMGVTEVVRGCDLLPSTFQQLYLYRLFGAEPPVYKHIPLLCNAAGQRLSKRDASLSLAEMFKTSTPEEIIGRVAYFAGLIPAPDPCTPRDLLTLPLLIPQKESIILPK